ncbi:MAG: Uma2 family endonuclease [Chromatiales bacterium]|nr:Uma2 family endonuclease [Chromatiales bacterium]
MSRATHTAATVRYPYCDGRPMAESEAQLVAMLYLLTALRLRFRDRPDVYVGGDMFIYHERGNPEAVVAPDVFVVVGAPKREDRPRLSYKLWEEPKGPDFVLEVVSRSTRTADLGRKRALYAALGVAEYWQLDPAGEQLASRLRGMRLAGGAYRDLVPAVLTPDGRTLRSAVLGLELRVERGGRLRLHDPAAGRDLPGHDEEHTARLAAEARVAELETLVRELRARRAQP